MEGENQLEIAIDYTIVFTHFVLQYYYIK